MVATALPRLRLRPAADSIAAARSSSVFPAIGDSATKVFSSWRCGYRRAGGARLYHVLESPSEFLRRSLALLFSRFGFAGSGDFSAD